MSLRGVPPRTDAAAAASGPASVPSSGHSSQSGSGTATVSVSATGGQRSVHRSISATSSKTGRRASSGGETREAATNASASGAATAAASGANAGATTVTTGNRASAAATPQVANHSSSGVAPTNFFRRQNTVDSATIKETSARLGAGNASSGGPTGVRPLASPAAIKNATANPTGAYMSSSSSSVSVFFSMRMYGQLFIKRERQKVTKRLELYDCVSHCLGNDIQSHLQYPSRLVAAQLDGCLG